MVHSAATDWGLAAPAPSRSFAKTFAVGVVLMLTATAAALLWKNYSPLLLNTTTVPGTDLADDERIVIAEDDEEEVPAALPDEADVPPAALPAAEFRRQGTAFAARPRGTLVGQRSFDADDSLEETDPRETPIRRTAGTIAGGRTSRPERGGSSVEEFDAVTEGLEAADDETLADQSEPAEDDSDEEPVDANRRPSMAGRPRVVPVEEVDDEIEVEEELQPRSTARGSRTFDADDPDQAEDTASIESDREAIDPVSTKPIRDDELPRLRLARPTSRDEEPEELVELAPPAGHFHSRSTESAGHATHLAAAEDLGTEGEELEGYVEVDPRERRALARTKVLPSTDSQFADTDRTTFESSPHGGSSGNGGHSQTANGEHSERVAISPRGRVAARQQPARVTAQGAKPAETSRRAHPAIDDSPAELDGFAGRYRVEHNDTFWSISKKVYGSPRYFQALAEHNRRHVPEPEQLRPGIELETPSETELAATYAKYIPGGTRRPSEELAESDLEERPVASAPRPIRRPAPRGARPQASDDAAAANPAHRGFFVSRGGELLYRVGDGDTLSSIAQQHLGKSSRSQELYQMNQDRLADPDRLRVGSILKLPADASRVGVVSDSTRIR